MGSDRGYAAPSKLSKSRTSCFPVNTTHIAIHIAMGKTDGGAQYAGHYADIVGVYLGSVPVQESTWGTIKALYDD